MKNEAERSKDRGKIAVLKKKLTPSEPPSDEQEKKSRKGKKLKKSTEDVKSTSKTTSFVRKFNFGKYMATPSAELSRASSSKSITESDTSDRLSSGYSTLTPTSLKRHGAEEGEEETGKPQPPPPVSVTPYAISTWRSADKLSDSAEQPDVRALEDEQGFMENKLSKNKDCEQTDTEDNNDCKIVVPENSADQESDITKSEVVQETEGPDSATEAMPAFGNLVMDLTKDRPDVTSNISQPGLERKEHLYKILVIGELGTGKTSIIKRYVHQFFSQHYRATIGVDFALKVLNWDANTIIRLQLWDIAGQERFGNMTRVYYKDAVGAFIVFDVTRVATFDAVDKWKQDLDSKVQLPDGSSIPCVLLGNKCDQQKEGIVNTPSRMDEYCKEKGFSGWFETSAKENVNIEEAARFLVNKILLNDKLLHSSDMNKDNDRIAIDDKGDANGHHLKSSKTCSC